MIKACITNLGKYNEGELCGEYLGLPATKGDVQDLLSYIGIDGSIYEEYIITDYETGIAGLSRLLGEYESIDELNYLAAVLADLDEWELEKFEAALEYGDYTSSVEQLINLAQNLDCYDLYPDIMNHQDLGIYYVNEMETLSIPEQLEDYIDYEAYGRDMSINDDGAFTKNGYMVDNGDIFIEHYKGWHVPDDYRIFTYPDQPKIMPVKYQLEAPGKLASLSNFVCEKEESMSALETIPPRLENKHAKESVSDIIDVLEHLEKAKRKPPIMETLKRLDAQIAQTKQAPAHEQPRRAMQEER